MVLDSSSTSFSLGEYRPSGGGCPSVPRCRIEDEITPLWWTPRERDYSPRRSANAEEKITPRVIQERRRTPTGRSGFKSVDEITNELGVSSSMLHRWRQRFESELEGGTQPSQGEREEIERLRSELRDVKAENTLLKKSQPSCATSTLAKAERAQLHQR
jgi:transposase-like protein